LVWTPSTAINDTAIKDAHSTNAIHPFLPLRLLKPLASSHSPFRPLLIALLPTKRPPPLRPSTPCFGTVSIQGIAVNQTAAWQQLHPSYSLPHRPRSSYV
jgi:hypothetical protein